MESKTIEMAALGRALHPGTLYDCRSDALIPGISLWDNETLKKGLDSRRQPKTDLNFSASDSLNEKAKLLEVSASLQASFLGGLVEVGGAARYMRDNKSSAHQSRVSLQFSQTTKFEQLTMDQMGNIKYPEVFVDGSATHVVTAVLYGGQAFMVFDLTANENEDKEEIEGNLNVMIQNIPSLSIEGAGALTMSESEKKLAESINCTFYGDYELEESPTTYMEALELYRKLPSILRERENDAVPMKVWLYPLAYLSTKAATLEREIHKTLITKTETLLEELGNAEIQCNDLITNTTVSNFQDVKLRLKTFQDCLKDYKAMFLKALRRLIPAIRGGTEQEQALADIITIHEKSPFREEKLNQWLEYRKGEVNLLNLYIQQLSGVPVIKYSALNNILFNPSVDTVVCFCFTSLTDEDPYLSILNTFMNVDVFEKLSAIPESADQDMKVWFQKPEVIENIKDKLFLFKGFSLANKDEKKSRFVIVSVSDPSNPGISIRLYKKGTMVDNAFQPVSKPPAPKVDVQDINITLKLQKSPTGSTVRFRVEYRAVRATDSETDVEKWEVTETPDAQENFILTGLELAKQYRIRYRAISDVGASEASDSVLFSAHGKYKVSVSKPWEIPYQAEISSGMKAGRAFHFKGVLPEDSYRTGAYMLLGGKKALLPHIGNFRKTSQMGQNPSANLFEINYKTGPNDGDDIAFQFRPELKAVVCNSCKNGKWEDKESKEEALFAEGEIFDIIMIITQNAYEVTVNGREFCKFEHRIPVDKVSTLQIRGDVLMNTCAIIHARDFLAQPLDSAEQRRGVHIAKPDRSKFIQVM
ncbi:cytolytic toxin-alpha-like [Neoarius graeffei]|uniref:cytolytic toxin-alpha-like n=1 Tax=Neoarius graeffei TaxID=443677 RepID=UPI00298C313F|nr:cytolytic toxin-alpha-like [Neoarius graeffei]